MFQQLGEVTDAPTASTTSTQPLADTVKVNTFTNPDTGMTVAVPDFSAIMATPPIGSGFDFGALSDPTQEVKPIPVISDEVRAELNRTMPTNYDQWTPAEQQLYQEGITTANQAMYENISAALQQYNASQPAGSIYTGTSGGSPVFGGGAPVPAGNTPAGGAPSSDRFRNAFTVLAEAVAGRRAPSLAASVRASQGGAEKKPVPGTVNTAGNVTNAVRAFATPENIQGAAKRIVTALVFSKLMGAL